MRPSVLILISGLALPCTAQIAGRGSLGAYAGLSIPTGEFARTWGTNTATFGGHVGFPMGVLPLQAGFAFSYSRMGNERVTVTVNETYIEATEGDLRVNMKVLSYHLLLRFSPLRGKVRPYVDGMLGFRHFTTTSRITVDGLEDPLVRERQASDLAFSTGWAAGLMIGLGKVGYVEARVERFNSAKASYVDPASITVSDEGGIGFTTLESNTDAVQVLLGIGLSF
jgi:hypothetical protein